jgi:hypothetical protein
MGKGCAKCETGDDSYTCNMRILRQGIEVSKKLYIDNFPPLQMYSDG